MQKRRPAPRVALRQSIIPAGQPGNSAGAPNGAAGRDGDPLLPDAGKGILFQLEVTAMTGTHLSLT